MPHEVQRIDPGHRRVLIYRAWINQPSTLQPLHKLNGMRCIAVDEDPSRPVVRLYFTTGAVHSMEAPRLSISKAR